MSQEHADPSAEGAAPLAFPEPEYVTGKRRRRRGLLALLTGFLLLLGIVALLYFSPLLPVRSIAVEGNNLLTDDEADQLLEDLYDEPMAQVGTGDIRQRLEGENVIADVDTRLELPSTVHVEIVEYPPVAEVQQGDSSDLYNEEGDVIATYSGDDQPDNEDYPTAEISSEDVLDDDAIFAAVVAVLGEVPEGARDDIEAASAESVDSVELELSDGRQLVWGSVENSDEKAAVMDAILTSEAEELSEAEVIDISTPNTPVTR